MSAAVEARGLTVRFGDFTAVDGISFSVEKGEIFGFLGANGAGKTTTIRVLCGLLEPSAGEVRVAGRDFSDGGRAIKSVVGYMSQRFTLYDDLTVGENLAFAADLRKMDPGAFRASRDRLLQFVSFDRPLDSPVLGLSGGVKQQVSLAAALLHDPEIVFLDEPTAGVSPAARERFWELIRRVAGQGKTVFVTTHYMDEAEQCGRIALMREGRLVAADSPAGLKRRFFKSQVYEFEPRAPLSFDELSTLAKDESFSFFEPYGLRFHAELRGGGGGPSAALQERFRVRPIEPSLEDVFIRAVEGRA